VSPAITDVPGVRVGHAHDAEAITGCTVILPPADTVGGVDVRGGGPSTRETDLLNPAASVNEIHAIALCGGSAFGQAATIGVVNWLYEHNIGYNISIARVPLVTAAVILDLFIGRSDRWPDEAMGYAACEHAGETVAEGCVGVGMGATVGKILGPKHAMKSGVGTWSETLADGTTIGALVVCNAFGDVWYEQEATIMAGVRNQEEPGRFANAMRLLRQPNVQRLLNRGQERENIFTGTNTTLAVVATDATLSKADTTKLARMAQDALPRAIRPIHTPFDGDTVFAFSTRQRPALHMSILGSVAADVLVRAIERSVTQATTIAGIPAASEWRVGCG
jgi:L-aminopeptidase/D-esterase-like protein